MELKKSPKADLENKRNLLLMVGLVVSLGLVLLAFEWTSKPSAASSLGQLDSAPVEDEIIPPTRQEKPPPPPPPPPKAVTILNIVNNDADIQDELQIDDSEADDNTVVDVAPVVTTEKEKTNDEDQVFYVVEEMPQFPGGDIALQKYITNAIKYPVIAQENGIQGKVYVSFVVNTDGSVTDAKIARSVDPSLDQEALRVINSLPKWKPGKQRGKPVRVSYTVPINFVLQ